MKIAVIGAGNMGGALIKGWAKSGQVDHIVVANRSQEKLDQLRALFPQLQVTTDNRAAVRDADIIILVVKPWFMDDVLKEIQPHVDPSRQSVVSCAANYGTEMLSQALGQGNHFYVIPNIAAEFNASMTFVARGEQASDEALRSVVDLFLLDGATSVVAEHLVEPGMMMASCGLAYVMRYVRAQMEGGVEMGFYPQQAKQIALQTMEGAVKLLKETGWHPEEAIDKVTTPGGITIKGLNELDHSGFNSAVIRSLKAGLKR